MSPDQNLPDSPILSKQVKNEEIITPSKNKNSYGQILKSSAIIGGATVITVLIGMVRTKFMAILLDPAGFGMMGLYTSITNVTQSIAGMGINRSGVKQIAEAVGSDDLKRITVTAQVLRRTAIFTGVLGTVFLFGFSSQISLLTFDDEQHANDIRLISLVIFFSLISAAQVALIQGMRRTSDLAKLSILGTIYGAIISIAAIYFLGEEGIALALVLIAAASLATSFWYRLKIKIPTHPMTISEMSTEQIALLKLGFAFLSSGLMMSGTAYIIRMMIVREIGIDAAGLYLSAWTMGGLYIEIILQAMGTDFYPRLTASAHDNVECNRLVNEQAHVGMLLAIPGIIATLTFAPLIIEIFYTSKFQGAAELLRWLCLGMAVRVISWPMGLIIVTKGMQKVFIYSDLAWSIVYVGLARICINQYQLNGTGIAFFGSYIFHVVMIYLIVAKVSGYRWSVANIQCSVIFLALIAGVFYSYYVLPLLFSLLVGIIALLFSSLYSIQTLINLVSLEKLPKFLAKLLSLLPIKKNEDYISWNTEKVQERKNSQYPINRLSANAKKIVYGFIIILFLAMYIYPLFDIQNLPEFWHKWHGYVFQLIK